MTGWFTVLPAGAPAPAQLMVFFLGTALAVRIVRTVLRWMGLA